MRCTFAIIFSLLSRKHFFFVCVFATMDIIEKVDIPNDNHDAVKLTTGMYQDSFILPSQSIINYDLTPLKFDDISSTEKDSEKVPPFVANLIDFSNENDDIMIASHATSNPTSNSIWY